MAKKNSSTKDDLKRLREAPLITPTDLGAGASKDIAGGMNGILADVFALYLKTKNFHWHVCGPHFRDYHLLLDEQADQIFAMTDPIAERVRKLGGTTLRSIGQIARLHRLPDNDAEFVEAEATVLREAYATILASASLYSIAAQWNKAGIKTTKGNMWTGTSVKQTTFLASYPGGSTWPGTSNVNLTTADSTAAVFAVVTLGPNHTINVRNQAGSVNAIVDLLGYYAPSAAGKYGAVGPTRIVDTRNGLGGHTGALTNTQTVQFHLPAGSGVPADATSVIVNVTATGQTRTGYLALSPNCSGASSTVNYLQAGYTRANLTIAGLDASGGFCVYNSGGPAQAIIDLVGYVGPSGTALYVPFTAPVRIVDTRTGNGGQLAPLGADSKITENDAGIFDVPYGAKALLTGVVSANASAASYFEVFPGTSPPAQATSTLNFTKGRVVSNAAIASLSGGTFGVYNRFGTASAIIDLFGYFV